jgi:uncharacterized protein YbaP (TraB family)
MSRYRTNKFLPAAMCLLALLAPARAMAADAPVVEANIQARLALWTVHSPNATAYLLGAIHILPANVIWHTPKIDAAIDASDTFVFEAPLDEAGKAAIVDFIRAHGMLPDGTALPSLLDEQGRKDYRDALALTKVRADRVDRMRPWLAAIVLETAYMEQQHYSPLSGVDRQILALAQARKKSLRYFETDAQQLALLAPSDQNLEVKEFDAGLRQFQSDASSLGPLVDAWSHGNAALVGRLMNKELNKDPGARKLLIDNRNDAWMLELAKMLEEHHTYFITVGTGHLVGPHGLPTLLRSEGFDVEGP